MDDLSISARFEDLPQTPASHKAMSISPPETLGRLSEAGRIPPPPLTLEGLSIESGNNEKAIQAASAIPLGSIDQVLQKKIV